MNVSVAVVLRAFTCACAWRDVRVSAWTTQVTPARYSITERNTCNLHLLIVQTGKRSEDGYWL